MPKPRKIVLIRHGESQGNIDKSLFERVPDHRIRLTERGRAQALEAGVLLRSILKKGDRIRMYVSPYARTRETASAIAEAIEDSSTCRFASESGVDDDDDDDGDNGSEAKEGGGKTDAANMQPPQPGTVNSASGKDGESDRHDGAVADASASHSLPEFCARKRGWQMQVASKRVRGDVPWDIQIHEEPRIREQDWGNFQDSVQMKKIIEDRNNFGSFFYRIPNGESGADVYDRVSTFMETLYRVFEKEDSPTIVIIVTHGLLARLFLMRFYHWSVESFESLDNLRNCEALHMVLDESTNKYRLVSELRRWKEVERGTIETSSQPRTSKSDDCHAP